LALFAGACGSSGTTSNAGPLVDNTQWEPTDDGEELFGPRPPDAVCDVTPMDCPEYPWPEGECVSLVGSSCVAAYVPECFDTLTVLAIYTRAPDAREPLCNWLTLEEPSLRDIRAGDRVEIRMRHSPLTAPVPNGEARMMFAIGGELALDYSVLIPSDYVFPSEVWTAPRDFPEGTQLLFHVDNHGKNEYMLIEARILEPGENTEL
jgi:hypothetical protein